MQAKIIPQDQRQQHQAVKFVSGLITVTIGDLQKGQNVFNGLEVTLIFWYITGWLIIIAGVVTGAGITTGWEYWTCG